MEFLNLSKIHLIDRIIPKESLYKNAALTEKEKYYFVNSVERVKLYYTLTTGNSNLSSNIVEECNYDEIVFIELKLKRLDDINKILIIIHSSIPKPLVIIGNYEDEKIVSVAYKTNTNNRVRIVEVYNTPLIKDNEKLKELSFEKVRASTISDTYKNYIAFVKKQMAQNLMKKSNLDNIEISNEKLDEFFKLQKELEVLLEQMKNEIQLKKRVELSLEIKKIKEKIYCIK